MIKKVTDGVHLIYCDFSDRLSYKAEGDGDEDGWSSIYFGDIHGNTRVEVSYKHEKDAILFGEMSKTSFHGILFDYDLYVEIMERE